MAVICATRLGAPGVALVLVAHLSLPLLAWLVSRAPGGGSAAIIRAVYPVLLLPGLYSAIDVLNGFGGVAVHDAAVQALEQALTGGQPARDWWRAAPSEFWSTLLHAVYFSYYIVVPLPIVVFLATGRHEAIDRYLTGLIATFLVCYLAYLLWPVAGPYYEFARPAGEFVANGPARLVYAALAKGSSYGAAFPSSHVAATVAATIGAWLAMPRLGKLLSIPTALLAVGVVYCQMHYVIDSLAGIVVGVAIPVLIATIERRPTSNPEPAS
jgi:membrane-associated phospholipid phosphatase